MCSRLDLALKQVLFFGEELRSADGVKVLQTKCLSVTNYVLRNAVF